MKSAEGLLELIPDIFYDTLAYFLPAILFIVGAFAISPPARELYKTEYLGLAEPFDKFVVVTLGMGILYIIGQLLTHFSYEVIQRPLRKFAAWRNDTRFPRSDIDWTEDYTFIRHTNAALGLEITKRYARIVMARNNALVAILLFIISLLYGQSMGAIVFGTLTPLFIHESYGRRVFFYLYLIKVAKELRNIDKKPESDLSTTKAG